MAEEEVHVRAPLFDRLVDLDPKSKAEVHPVRSLDRAGLRESVRRELERLLNTRISIPARELEGRELTVIDYGIPDFSTYSDANQMDWKRLEEVLARVIQAFEPRLREVRVRVESYRSQSQRLRARIDAMLVAERVAEPVSFPAVIAGQEGQARVDATA